MRSLLVLTLLAACELKPPPPKAEPAPAPGSAMEAKAPVAPVPPPAPPPTPPPNVNAGSGSAAAIPTPAVSEACQNVAIKITDILIANGDPTQRAFLEQERARTVRQSGLSCQRNNWNAAKIACFMAATKFADLDACNKLP